MCPRLVMELEALHAQPGEPGLFMLWQLHPRREPREHALVGREVRVVFGVHRWIGRDIGVSEERRIIARTACGLCDVVEAVCERRAVDADAVVHLVEAGVEACPRRRAGGRLAVMV